MVFKSPFWMWKLWNAEIWTEYSYDLVFCPIRFLVAYGKSLGSQDTRRDQNQAIYTTGCLGMTVKSKFSIFVTESAPRSQLFQLFGEMWSCYSGKWFTSHRFGFGSSGKLKFGLNLIWPSIVSHKIFGYIGHVLGSQDTRRDQNQAKYTQLKIPKKNYVSVPM